MEFIGCDAHKKYSIFASVTEKGRVGRAVRVGHDRATFRKYLEQLPSGSPIAVESSGSWYWLIDEIEQAGHQPHLVNAGEAKRRMGKPNKTDSWMQKDWQSCFGTVRYPKCGFRRLRYGTSASCYVSVCFLWRFVQILRTAFTVR